jgi:Transcription factor WhiB
VNPVRQAAVTPSGRRPASVPGPAGRLDRLHRDPAALTDRQLTDLLTSPLAGCAGPGMDPDVWYPVARGERARVQAAQAIAVCSHCAVRLDCLEMSMRQWAAGGQHGIWGGLLESERVTVYAAWQAGAPVARLPAADAAGRSLADRRGGAVARLADRRRGPARIAAATADGPRIGEQTR